MANYLGPKLSRLIRERAYLSGTLLILQKEFDLIKLQLEAKATSASNASERLNELDKQIIELSAIEPLEIRAIRLTPRVMHGSHGSFRRELVWILQNTDEPISTGPLVQYMAEMFSLSLDTHQQRTCAREKIRGPLNILKKRGVVTRLPSLEGSTQGRWQWNHAADDNQP
jgi:hypothetical protein